MNNYSHVELHDFEASSGREPQLDRGLSARDWCIFGLTISWMVGSATVVSGVLFLVYGQPLFILSEPGKEALPLLINILVTLLNESMGYIHGTSLRWSLLAEGKLRFNSNLRLISHTRGTLANSLPANVFVLICIVITYTTPFLIFLGYNSALDQVLGQSHGLEDKDKEIHVSSIAFIFFGGGLIGQALFATWAIAATRIPTWSSNPLDVLLACWRENTLQRRTGRCMFSVHDCSRPTMPIRPKARQGPACTAHHEVKWILMLLWGLISLGAIWGVTIYMMIRGGNPNGVLGESWSFLPVFVPSKRCASNPDRFCTAGTSVLNVGWSKGDTPTGVIGSIFMVAGFQAVLTLALHCAELLVNMSRDESIWRQATGPKGTDSNYNSIIAACTSWQTVSLFVFKAAVHWLFGLSVNVSYFLGINMYPSQIFYLTASALVVALLATYWSIRRPAGPQPAAYGHLQTLSDLIDDWHHCMYWGQKAAGVPGYTPAYAGTSSDSTRVRDIDMAMEYGGELGRQSATGSGMGRRSYQSLQASAWAQKTRSPKVGWWARLWTGLSLGWYEPMERS
jgi:hypothetical protein